MKQKFLLSLVFVCTLITTTHAQIKKGAIWLGGTLGYNQVTNDYEQQDENKTKSLRIKPAVGLVIEENLVAGVALSYSLGRVDNYGYTGATMKDNSYGVGLFVRRYIPVVSRFYIYGEANADYTIGRAKEKRINDPSIETKSWFASLGLSPGISFSINKKIQLESGVNNLFAINYGKTKRRSHITGDNVDIESLNAGINLEAKSPFYFGFRFLINNKE